MDTQQTLIPKRPTAVSLIGWFSLAISIFFLFICFSTLLLMSNMKPMHLQPNAFDQAPLIIKSIKGFFSPFYLKFAFFSGIYQVILAIVILISSIKFLQLRYWARNGLEIAYWLQILEITIIMIVYFWTATSSVGGITTEPIFTIFFFFLMLFSLAVNIAPFLLLVYFLRSKSVKEIFVRN